MQHVLSIAGKDLSAEFRKKGVLNTVLLFSVLVLLVMYFSIDHDPDTLHTFGPPAFWISLIFSSFLGLNHFMQSERTNDCLLALKTSPAASWTIFVGKSLSLVVMLTLVELILIPVFLMMFAYGFALELLLFAGVVMLGNVAIAITGALFSGMLVAGRASAFLLPIVMIPILLPLLIAGVRASSPLLSATVGGFNRPGTPVDVAIHWVLLLIGMDLLLVSAGTILSNTVYST
jgi:heme exporter protein B